MDSTSLPPELIALIIDHLPDPILRECSFVCQLWRDLCQMRLFRTCELTPWVHLSVENFYEIVKNCPQIAAYPRTVNVVFSLDAYITYAGADKDVYDLLIKIFPLLVNVTHMRLTRKGMRVSWSTWPAELLQAFFQLFHRPTLGTLEIEGWYIDTSPAYIQTLFNNPSLKTFIFRSEILKVNEPSFPCTRDSSGPLSTDLFPSLENALEMMTPTSRCVRLQNLSIEWQNSDMSALIAWLCHPYCVLDLTYLTSLELRHLKNGPNTKYTFADLLVSTGPTLENLYLTIDADHRLPIPDLSLKASLRILTVAPTTFRATYYPQESGLVRFVVRMMDTISIANHLSKVRLTLPSVSAHSVVLEQLVWEDFVGMLTQERFTNLEDLSITFMGGEEADRRLGEFIKHLFVAFSLKTNLEISMF